MNYVYGAIYGAIGDRLTWDRPHTEPPVRNATLASIMNELTERGWEFVSLSSAGNNIVCLLRRPKV